MMVNLCYELVTRKVLEFAIPDQHTHSKTNTTTNSFTLPCGLMSVLNKKRFYT